MRVTPTQAELADFLDKDAALDAVWDNIHMAESFIGKAREAVKGEGDVRLRWCLYIAAGALWSARDIFNKRVAPRGQRLYLRGRNWSLVSRIRHGAVHYDEPRYSVGEQVTVRETTVIKSIYLAEVTDGSTYKEIPISTALLRLTKVARSVRQRVWDKMQRETIPFV